MNVAIIIPTYNRPLMLQRLLEKLAQCDSHDDAEVVVVENGPKCGVEEICLKARDNILNRYLYTPTGSRSVALNHGIAIIDADFYIFFDDDIGVSPSIIKSYLEAAHRYGPGHFFGGPLLADAEVECPAHLAPYLPGSAKGWHPSDHEMELDPSDHFFGANWGVFRSDLAKVGHFAESLGVGAATKSPVGEEAELQKRLFEAGMKGIYLPEAVITHPVPKECYTLQWVRHRMFRQGLTEWIMGEHDEKTRPRRVLGVPTWIIRAALEQKAMVAISNLFNYSLDERTRINIREAQLAGMLQGAWQGRKAATSGSTGGDLG